VHPNAAGATIVQCWPMTRNRARPGPGDRTTLLIVDDHGDFRRQARALLEAEGLEVVGEAADGWSALAAAAALRPALVLLDIALPDIDGFEVAARLAASEAAPGVVLISSRDAATYGGRIAASPVAGFVRKDDLSAEALAGLAPDGPRGPAQVRGPGAPDGAAGPGDTAA
jgi:CheY-like chemotaxis protein